MLVSKRLYLLNIYNVRYCSKHFTYINSCNFHHNLLWKLMYREIYFPVFAQKLGLIPREVHLQSLFPYSLCINQTTVQILS